MISLLKKTIKIFEEIIKKNIIFWTKIVLNVRSNSNNKVIITLANIQWPNSMGFLPSMYDQ